MFNKTFNFKTTEWCYCIARESKDDEHVSYPYKFHCKCGFDDGLEADEYGREHMKNLYSDKAQSILIPVFKYQPESFKQRGVERKISNALLYADIYDEKYY